MTINPPPYSPEDESFHYIGNEHGRRVNRLIHIRTLQWLAEAFPNHVRRSIERLNRLDEIVAGFPIELDAEKLSKPVPIGPPPPVFLCRFPERSPDYIMVDGSHRLARAHIYGVAELSAISFPTQVWVMAGVAPVLGDQDPSKGSNYTTRSIHKPNDLRKLLDLSQNIT